MVLNKNSRYSVEASFGSYIQHCLPAEVRLADLCWSGDFQEIADGILVERQHRSHEGSVLVESILMGPLTRFGWNFSRLLVSITAIRAG